jgi:DNA invertase Pin-like site-specific DNA recombinase
MYVVQTGKYVIISYSRVSTDRQDVGLDAQQAAINAWCAIRGVSVDHSYVERLSGKNMKRPELQKAMQHVEGHGGTLVVAKIDRLSRSVSDFATLVERATKNGWSIVICDLNIDMTTPSGLLIANIMASLAQWERSMIGLRIKEALAEKRKLGIRPGRPVSDTVARRIGNMNLTGQNLHEIARTLNSDGVATAGGGKQWYASTVRGVLRRTA